MGGIIDTYEHVSATTSYEVLEVGLLQVDDAQGTATLVVSGRYVVQSTAGSSRRPRLGVPGDPEGAQSCTQRVRVRAVQVDGDGKIDELTLLATS